MVAKVLKISQKIKKKNLVGYRNKYYRVRKKPYYNYKKLLF